jgi:hypothetical protein
MSSLALRYPFPRCASEKLTIQEYPKMTRQFTSSARFKMLAVAACFSFGSAVTTAQGLGSSSPSSPSTGGTSSLGDSSPSTDSPSLGGGSSPFQRGVNEAFSESREGNSLDDSIRAGVGEAGRTAADATSQDGGQSLQTGNSASNLGSLIPGGTDSTDANRLLESQQRDGDQQLNGSDQLNASRTLNTGNRRGGQSNARGQAGIADDSITNGMPSRVTPFGTGNVYQDSSGRNYVLDSQGRRVFTNQGTQGSVESGITGQDAIVGNLGTSMMRGSQGPRLGVFVEPAQQGVRIMEVQQNSMAQQTGLQRNDVILSVNGQPTPTRHALIQSLASSADGRMLLVIQRNGERQQLTAIAQASDSRYQMARPELGEPSQNATSDEVNNLRNQVSEMKQQLDSLRQQVEQLQAASENATVTANETELLNNTSPSPAEPAPKEEDVDLFGDDSEAETPAN